MRAKDATQANAVVMDRSATHVWWRSYSDPRHYTLLSRGSGLIENAVTDDHGAMVPVGVVYEPRYWALEPHPLSKAAFKADYSDLEARVLALVQPISNAPRDGTQVICIRGARAAPGQWVGRRWAWGYADAPTHWMPHPGALPLHTGRTYRNGQ